MAAIVWDQIGQRFYETGVDHGVLYRVDDQGAYSSGYAWNGLTSVDESPDGAEPNPLYADNIKYLNLMSAEEFGCTIEAYTYPDEFAECDGSAEVIPGMFAGQQTRKMFGLSYRTKIGNDVDGEDHGYKLHLVYGCRASVSDRSYETINDNPDAIQFSWEVNTTPVELAGYKPTSLLTFDSRKFSSEFMTQLKAILYGSEKTEPRMPMPNEIVSLFQNTEGGEPGGETGGKTGGETGGNSQG